MAVFFGTLLPCLFVLPFQNETYWLLLGLTILLVVGLVDDINILRPHQKFLGQLIAVACFLYAGFYVHPTMVWRGVAIGFSGFWMLTVINAFNLVDVMDGLACTLALCASIGFFVLSIYLQHIALALIFVAFIGSLLGFLCYNKPQATIYLGDAGSLFLGGILAVLPCGLNLGKYSNAGYGALIIMLALPLLELVSLVVIRTYKKIPFYKGSTDHFSMYLQLIWNGVNQLSKSIVHYVCSWLMSLHLLFVLNVLNLLTVLAISLNISFCFGSPLVA